ncbi:hypothetical protein [Actinoplanes subtropicus]|uniref:hypothetical protein n=1 Tax=Actinoplanes subtropicus TaxID=543632 RepID=UPI000A989967|nr:hypothetical protein [Actinoplanes subtropicus]
MRVRRILGAVALTAATSLSFVLPAAAASAAGTCGHSVHSPDGGATVCFNPTGEHLLVCDTNDDGHHPGAWYVIGNGINWHNPQYNLGAGNCHDINLDLAETDTITYQACNYEGTKELSCSSYAVVGAAG